MGQEIEQKYRATPQTLDLIRSAIPGNYTTIEMETTYYDTPDRELSARRWTLRCRRENGRHICTLKTPGTAPGARGEWETECDDILVAIPVLAGAADLPELEQLTSSGVIPTCGARFTRQALTLTTESVTAELALDKGVLLGGSKTLPFAEVEMELKSGSAEALSTLAQSLAERFGLTAEPASKFARARMLAQEG